MFLDYCLNRTFMELKFVIIRFSDVNFNVLIEPLWN